MPLPLLLQPTPPADKIPVTGAFTASSRPYDGTATATIVTRTLTGVIPGEDCWLTGGIATFANKNVGTGKTVTGTGFTLTGADAGRYELVSSTLYTTADIIARTVFASVTVDDKVYDGNTTATISERKLLQAIAGDDISLTGGTATFDTSAIGNNKTVTVTGLSLGGAETSNYSLDSSSITTYADIVPTTPEPPPTPSPYPVLIRQTAGVIVPAWQFYLTETFTNTRLGLLVQTRDKSINMALNRSGTLSCSIPLDHPLALSVVPRRTFIEAVRNGQTVWSGPVWNLEQQLPENRMSITCVGWFEILNQRLLPKRPSGSYTYSDMDAGLIASRLLELTNSRSATTIVAGTIAASINRTRSYQPLDSIGKAIQDLSDIENGFDWWIDPVSREFNVYAARGSTKTNALFGYNSPPNNLSSLSCSVDGSIMANSVTVQGKNAQGFQEDNSSKGLYGLIEDVKSLSDVGDATILVAYAGVEVALRSSPRMIYSMTPFPDDGTGHTPGVFDDYNLGDIIFLNASWGPVQASLQPCRIFGFDISVSEEGNEMISAIHTTPQ